ncbi:MAG: imidazolonepropionase [Glaciecola sp.]|jgi:imidazolonepropionase
MQTDFLYKDCTLATMEQGANNYGLIENAAFVVGAGRILWRGKINELPQEYTKLESESLEGRLVTPALIDCHTHLVFGGNRAQEFEQRLKGASYSEISKAGGGIVSTVNATRNASDEELLSGALKRLDALMSEGVGVVEIKSGYGLSIEHELRMLRVARKLATLRPVKIMTTWLAAHALPPEYAGKNASRFDDYIDDVVIPGLRQAASENLVDAVDGFCENIAFSCEQIERVFAEASALGLPIKLHAEQLSDQKGALLAAKYNGLSADHLEYLAEEDVPTFAKSGAVAVMLPGAFYTLNESKQPPIESFRLHAVDMAVATDCNPGSSPISSILTAMNMACTQFSMTPEEALAGSTRCAAKALGLQNECGEVKVGAHAELAVWDATHPAELSYWIGTSLLHKRISHQEPS